MFCLIFRISFSAASDMDYEDIDFSVSTVSRTQKYSLHMYFLVDRLSLDLKSIFTAEVEHGRG